MVYGDGLEIRQWLSLLVPSDTASVPSGLGKRHSLYLAV